MEEKKPKVYAHKILKEIANEYKVSYDEIIGKNPHLHLRQARSRAISEADTACARNKLYNLEITQRASCFTVTQGQTALLNALSPDIASIILLNTGALANSAAA